MLTAAASATKHGLRVVSEGLRLELAARQWPVRVTTVSPGPVTTGFNRRAFGAEVGWWSG